MSAIDAVAKSTPDCYTIGAAIVGHFSINQFLIEKMPYDAEKDLVAPSLTGTCAKWASSAPKVSNGGTNLGLNDKTAEREVLARADKDFERLFGAD
jgi:hypothetical protein